MKRRRVNQLWKQRQKKSRYYRRLNGCSESSFRQKKFGADKKVIYYEGKEPDHYKNEFTKLNKENPNKKFFGKKKKVILETWDDSKSFEDDLEEKQTNMELMAKNEASE